MNKAMPTYILFLLLLACNNTTQPNTEKVANSGTATVKTAAGTTETFKYTCTGCAENLKNAAELEQLANKTIELVKKEMEMPETLKPVSAEFVVEKRDDLFYWENNKPIENALSVTAYLSYTAQKADGSAISDEGGASFYMKDGKPANLENEIRPDSLATDQFGNIKTPLLLFSQNDEEYIVIKPLLASNTLQIEYGKNCLKKEDQLVVTFVDGADYKLQAHNVIGCKAYFDLTGTIVKQLGRVGVTSVKLVSQKPFTAAVPKNRSDYFMQLAKVYK